MEATAILLASSFGGVAGFILGLLFLPSKHELLVGPAMSHTNTFFQAVYKRRSRLQNVLLVGLPSLAILFCLALAPLYLLRAVGYVSPPAPTVAIFALPVGALGGHLVRSRLWQKYSSHLTIRSSGRL
jgi:Mn2+/Fe2+ NRAMP family transporter